MMWNWLLNFSADVEGTVKTQASRGSGWSPLTAGAAPVTLTVIVLLFGATLTVVFDAGIGWANPLGSVTTNCCDTGRPVHCWAFVVS